MFVLIGVISFTVESMPLVIPQVTPYPKEYRSAVRINDTIVEDY